MKLSFIHNFCVMFPSNLHKNILQLDKQISLLENECKSKVMDKKKKVIKSEISNNKCSRAISSQIKPKPGTKKTDIPKRNSKPTPPYSARIRSASSIQSTISKPWSETGEVQRKNKQRGIHTTTQNYLSVRNETESKNKMKCMNVDKDSISSFPEKDCSDQQDHVLHKEIIFSNSGERIEVTLTQKSSDDLKENLLKKKNNDRNMHKNVSCNCYLKGQKWSEILGIDHTKRKEDMARNSASLNTLCETQKIYQPFCCAISKVLSEKGSRCSQGTETPNANFDSPAKPSHPVHKIIRPTSHVCKPEKETQCYLDDNESLGFSCKQSNLYPASKISTIEPDHRLMEEKKPAPVIEREKLPQKDFQSYHKLDNKNELNLESTLNGFSYILKQHSDNFEKEKELLVRELSSKNSLIETMKKREEEYLSVISNLKHTVEKLKENVQKGEGMHQELKILKKKFFEQAKVCDGLKKSHSRMQKVLERCALENDKLKTQTQIYKLESQKHDVLLAAKESEIKRYKEEIGNFQKQISEHLATLKTNAQAIDVEKMMEAIMQQSQIFVQKDTDSVVFDADKFDSSKQFNGLMHSSPTSTKNSVVNSSWKRISSIRDPDPSEKVSQVKENTDKEYFQIFGESPKETKTKKLTENLLEKLLEEDKTAPSFTSCISVRDDDDCGYSSTSKNDITVKQNKLSLESAKQAEIVQSNIDELLKNMKFRWSKEVRGTSSENCTIDDFLNSSQISSISAVSGNLANVVVTPGKRS